MGTAAPGPLEMGPKGKMPIPQEATTPQKPTKKRHRGASRASQTQSLPKGPPPGAGWGRPLPQHCHTACLSPQKGGRKLLHRPASASHCQGPPDREPPWQNHGHQQGGANQASWMAHRQSGPMRQLSRPLRGGRGCATPNTTWGRSAALGQHNTPIWAHCFRWGGMAPAPSTNRATRCTLQAVAANAWPCPP